MDDLVDMDLLIVVSAGVDKTPLPMNYYSIAAIPMVSHPMVTLVTSVYPYFRLPETFNKSPFDPLTACNRNKHFNFNATQKEKIKIFKFVWNYFSFFLYAAETHAHNAHECMKNEKFGLEIVASMKLLDFRFIFTAQVANFFTFLLKIEKI